MAYEGKNKINETEVTDYEIHTGKDYLCINRVTKLFINDNGDAVFYRNFKLIVVIPWGQYTMISAVSEKL